MTRQKCPHCGHDVDDGMDTRNLEIIVECKHCNKYIVIHGERVIDKLNDPKRISTVEMRRRLDDCMKKSRGN